jgi:hypothetical protein
MKDGECDAKQGGSRNPGLASKTMASETEVGKRAVRRRRERALIEQGIASSA